MSRIKIRNFGPIKNGLGEDWIEIKKVTLFIGDQGSGKSTVAKLITTFIWIEKALVRGDYDIRWFARKNKLKNQFLKYFRLENYFSDSNDNTEIDYRGEAYCIKYQKGNLIIEDVRTGSYDLPQIMYVPAERNFISNVRTPKALKLTSSYLLEFVTEFDNAKQEIKGTMKIPIDDNTYIEYSKLNDIIYVKGDGYRIKLTESSSGFQSVVPLHLVSWFLSNSIKSQSENTKGLMTIEQRERFRKRFKEINENISLTDEQKRIIISELGKEFTKTAFINIVEEPEQNLFPNSQQKMLNSLIEFNNLNRGNKLIITSHSPYLINYITLAVKADSIKSKITTQEDKNRLYNIVPERSTIEQNSIVVYELGQPKGSIKKLEDYKGMPSDLNYLNQNLAEINYKFDDLLQIEKKWQ